MNIYELQQATCALERGKSIGTDNLGFIKHLLHNKDKDLSREDRLWLKEITGKVKVSHEKGKHTK